MNIWIHSQPEHFTVSHHLTSPESPLVPSVIHILVPLLKSFGCSGARCQKSLVLAIALCSFGQTTLCEWDPIPCSLNEEVGLQALGGPLRLTCSVILRAFCLLWFNSVRIQVQLQLCALQNCSLSPASFSATMEWSLAPEGIPDLLKGIQS